MDVFSETFEISSATLEKIERQAAGNTKSINGSRIPEVKTSNNGLNPTQKRIVRATNEQKSSSNPPLSASQQINLEKLLGGISENDFESQFTCSSSKIPKHPELKGLTQVLNFESTFDFHDKRDENKENIDSDVVTNQLKRVNISSDFHEPEENKGETSVITVDVDTNRVCTEPELMDYSNSHDDKGIFDTGSVSFMEVDDEEMQNALKVIKDTQKMSESLFSDDMSFNEQITDSSLTEGTLQWQDESFKTMQKDTSLERSFKRSSQIQEKSIPLEVDTKKNLKLMSNWGLPKTVLAEYHKKGIVEMFDWQCECLSNTKLLFEGSNLVYSAPTSAGKTLVSEILMTKIVVEKRKKALMILPFVSVVREKMLYLQDLLTPAGIRVEGFFGGYHPPGGFDQINISICTIEKANSIINRLLETNTLADIGVIVVDEVHLLSDYGRGYILELLLAKVMYMCQKYGIQIQIITMSATLPNLFLLRDWLRAELYHTTFRPIELREMIKIGGCLYDSNLKVLRQISTSDPVFARDQDNVGQLCIETLLEGCAVLVFCPGKDWCEELARNVARIIHEYRKLQTRDGQKLVEQIQEEGIKEIKIQLSNLPGGLEKSLDTVLTYACAFHHAGLTSEEREIIEIGFKEGVIKIIVATSTLSSGVNLPARRVVIRTPLFGGKTMDGLTYKQMIGRAGRKGKDTLGESILICTEAQKKAGESLVSTELQPLSSCLDINEHIHLKRALLETIASNVVQTRTELESFIKCTLLYSENKLNMEQPDLINSSIDFLLNYEFIRMQHNEESDEDIFVATKLGCACLSASLPPSEGLMLFSELQKARQCFVLESELHAIYLVTPYSVCYQLHNVDWLRFVEMWESLPKALRRIGEVVGVTNAFLMKAMRSNNNLNAKQLQIHKRFYIALALQELVNEVPLNKVASKYKCSKGMLQTLQQMASIFAGVVTSFCKALNWGLLAIILDQFKDRLFFGIHRELMDLMQIQDLNAQRARALFNAGIKDLKDLATSDAFTVEKILYDCISFDTDKQKENEAQCEANERIIQRKLFITGKLNVSVSDAAKMMIEQARQFLLLEMGVKNVDWGNKTSKIEGVNNEVVEISDDDQTPKRKQNTSTSSLNSSTIPSTPETDLYAQRLMRRRNLTTSVSNGNSKHLSLFDQSQLMEVSESLSSVNDQKRSNSYQELHIVDVCKNRVFFDAFVKEINENIREMSVAVGLSPNETPIKQTIGGNLLQNGIKPITEHEFPVSPKKYMDGIAFCFSQNYVYYMTMQKTDTDDVITTHTKIQLVNDILNRSDVTLTLYDAKEHFKTITTAFNKPLIIQATIFDPKVASWLLDPDVDNTLDNMVLKYAQNTQGILNMIDRIGSFNSIGLNYRLKNDARIRCCVEACVVQNVMQKQVKMLQDTGKGNLYKSFTAVEMPIQLLLYRMEHIGMAVAKARLLELKDTCLSLQKQISNEIHKQAGYKFNIDSTTEVAKVLNLQKVGKAKPSTSKDTLKKLNNPIAELIMQYRQLSTALTKFLYPFIKNGAESDRIYSKTCHTNTGRLSMYEPSLQNVPKNFVIHIGNQSHEVSCRSAFIPPAGRKILTADFCQLELRILTHLSQDKTLIQIMNSTEDVFKLIAAKWYKTHRDEVTTKQRNDAKQICYGIIYGMGVRAFAESLGTTEDEAQSLVDQFHMTYPGIRNYTENIIKRSHRHGFVETIMGRRRYLPNLSSDNLNDKRQAERQAVNTTIQGSAADIAKLALLRMEKNLTKHEKDLGINSTETVDLVLHLHDELVYEVPSDIVKKVAKLLKCSMENCIKLSIPLQVKVKTGNSWGDLTDIKI